VVHEVAEQGFGTEAEVYEQARPSYPPDAVAWLGESLGIEPGRRVVDLAAGTGKLTRLLVPFGAGLVAIEPVAGMRAVLVRAVPGVPAVAATAEAIPVADASIDVITVAQAFHWFDHERAIAELRRALRVGGRVALLWNARDRSRPWVDAVWAIMDRVEKRAPWRDHESWRVDDVTQWPGFDPFVGAEFRHEQPVTVDSVAARFASVSHVAVLPEPERAAVLDEVRAVAAAHAETDGELSIPYRVDVMWAERTS
jgi:SAM-dependent methyltransferase